jgi:nucleoid-associated protein YgaU
MAGLGFRPLAKLMILPTGGEVGVPFVAMYNPTTLSFQRGQELTPKFTTVKVEGKDVVVESKNDNPETLNIELFFDGTSASPPMGIPGLGNLGPVGAAAAVAISAVGVDALITLFFKSLGISRKDHTSKVVKLVWGAGLLFRCKLQSATVNYTLINRLGLPLRATVSASFVASGDEKLLASLISRLQSPDVTKTHIVKAGDTLYNIAKEEYDSESFYLEIAKANDLKNYRKLKPGQILILPPIKQNEV